MMMNKLKVCKYVVTGDESEDVRRRGRCVKKESVDLVVRMNKCVKK
jgi:hypothetical protein